MLNKKKHGNSKLVVVVDCIYFFFDDWTLPLPSVLQHCWVGNKINWPVRTECQSAGGAGLIGALHIS